MEQLALSEEIGNILRKHKLTIATAESCSGGALLSRLTDIPGSRAYVIGGMIAYSNRIKIDRLGVNESDIKKQGAVSETVALQMAQNIAKLMRTDIGVSTTGIAGPGGGTSEKPVGIVWIGFWCPGKHFALRKQFDGDRLAVKDQTIGRALKMVHDVIV